MIDALVIDQTYQLKDIDLIDPSPLNPRKTFDQARLADLAASIKEAGVIEPLVVRPGKKDRVELVAGERRWRAAKLVGLTALPIVLRSLSDTQVLTLMAIENEQRDDIHPLERAAGYQALMKADATFTPETIAKRIGKSKRWVQLCLQYLTLIPDVQKAFREGQITAGHADLIVRLAAGDQSKALAACFHQEQEYGLYELGEKNTPVTELVSVRDLDEWIKQNIRLPLDAASPQLELLPEVKEAIEAANPVFHKDAPRLLELIDSHWVDPKIKHPPLSRKAWTFVKKGDKCAAPQRGVIVYGAARGRVVNVCTGVGVCATHWPTTIARPSSPRPSKPGNGIVPPAKKSAAQLKGEKDMAEAREHDKLWKIVHPAAVKLARERAAKLPVDDAISFVFDQLDHYGGNFHTSKCPSTLTGLVQLLVDEQLKQIGDDENDFEFEIADPLGLKLDPLFKAAKKTAAAPKTAAAAKTINWKTHFADEGRKKKPATKKRPTLGKGK